MLRVRKSNTGMFTQLISDARAAEWETIKPEDSDRLFYKMAWWKKVIVMAGGPTVNLLIAFFLFWGLFATWGQRTLEPEPGQPVIDTVSACVIAVADEGRDCARRATPPSPAAEAGLRPGDVITCFNGTPVDDWDAAAHDDPRQRRRPGRDRLRARRRGPDRHHQHHGPGPADLRHRPDAGAGRLPRRHADVVHQGRDRRPALHARPDGHDDRRDRQGARPPCR